MIYSMTGRVKKIQLNSVVVTVGLFDIELQVPVCAIAQAQELTWYTHLHWHQEQGPSLYGFLSELDRTVFLLIISCSGIGPKIGLAVLSHLPAAQFLEAIQAGHVSTLSAVNGIGTKKAEQLILQLKDKVAKLISSGIVIEKNGTIEQWNLVSQTLESLNYSRAEIQGALKYITESNEYKNAPFDLLMRKALTYLAKKI